MGALSKKALFAAGVLVLSLAGGASAQTVRIGIAEDPDVLDPAQGATFVGRIVFASFCDKLIDTDPKLNYVPQLATAWEWSSDNKALSLKLRPNVVFHDGTPLDAEAVKINLDRYRTADYSKRRSELKTVINVVVVDPLTVRLELSQPDAPLLSILADRAGMMLSPKAIASLGQNIATKPVCAGPFKFVERVPQQKIVFEKFEEYWDKQNIHLQQVVYMPMADVTVRTTNVRSGSLEIAERLQPSDLKEIARDKRVKIATSTALAYNVMSINIANGPRASTSVLAKDPRVREALEMAIDRQIIMQVVFDGEFVATNQPQAVDSPWYIKDRPVPQRDVEKAKKLLAEAGVSKPSFTLSVTQNPVDGQIAQVIQSMAGEAGFDVKVEVLESNTLTGNTNKGVYDAATVIWSGRTDPDGNISIWLACDGFLNWGKYCNKDVDAALAAARSKVNPTERLVDYTKAAHIYLQDRPHLFLFNHKWIWALSAKTDGFVPNPDGIIRLRGVKLGS
jgi:peptide/nickel transport system substrate-binding protein